MKMPAPCFAAMLLLLPVSAFAQTLTTGDVAGTITDSSGAVVPNAAITLKNVATNETRTAPSNNSGQYRFSLLSPGDYTISAETAGLKSALSKIAVSVGQVRETNITLSVQ